MKWYANLKIGSKLFVGFGIILMLVIVLAVYSIITAKEIDDDNSYMKEYPITRLQYWLTIESNFNGARRALSHMSTFAGTDDAAAGIGNQLTVIDSMLTSINTNLTTSRQSVNRDRLKTEEERVEINATIDNLTHNLIMWRNEAVTAIMQANLDNDKYEVKRLYDSYAHLADGLFNDIESLRETARSGAEAMNTQVSQRADQAVMTLIIISSVIFVLAIFIALYITRTIRNPVVNLVKLVSDVTNGNIDANMNMPSANDEIGLLTQDIYKLVDVIKTILKDLTKLTYEFDKNGDIDYRIDAAPYHGAYKELITSLNMFVGSTVSDTMEILRCISEIGEGNFDSKIKEMPGKKKVLSDQFDLLRVNFKGIHGEISAIAKDAADGKLSTRVETVHYKGNWKQLLQDLNALVHAIEKPISEIEHVLGEMSKGNFGTTITGNYKGEFDFVKQAVNKTEATTMSYVEDISKILGSIAKGDLTVSIDREYIGSYEPIKVALNSILDSLNESMTGINCVSVQLLAGATQVAESATLLAEGSTRQASAMQELTSSISMVDEKTRMNSESADNANRLSTESNQRALSGSEATKEMLAAMKGIKESTDNISSVLKIIQDIAFQTNLLALNAAVEAARAGDHGKGFAVVAEEVRNLAARSQDSAKTTTAMVEDSRQKAYAGIEAANGTATSLELIVSGVEQMSDLISGIAHMSQDQADAISQIAIGMNEISSVVQSNAATSEECAATSQELNSQALMLQESIAYFRLRSK